MEIPPKNDGQLHHALKLVSLCFTVLATVCSQAIDGTATIIKFPCHRVYAEIYRWQQRPNVQLTPMKGLSADGKTLTLRRLPSHQASSLVEESWRRENKEFLKTAVILDVETTGFDPSLDKVIQIALRTIEFDIMDGKITNISEPYTALEDPKEWLSTKVQAITGLREKDLVGKSINWKRVQETLEGADLVLAHNARFDRAFIEGYLPSLKNVTWGDTLTQIDWRSRGHSSADLERLAFRSGFFFEAHDASEMLTRPSNWRNLQPMILRMPR